jgi:LysM repeat protein
MRVDDCPQNSFSERKAMKQLCSTALLVLVLFVAVACTSPSPTPPMVAPDELKATQVAVATQSPLLIQPVPSSTPTLEPALITSATPIFPLATAQPTPCRPPADWVDYTVKPGDTLFGIAYNTGISVDQLKLANCLVGDTIYAGQKLFVPFIPYIPPAFSALPPVQQPVRPQRSAVTLEQPPPPLPGNQRIPVTPFSGPAGITFTFAITGFFPSSTVTLTVISQDTEETVFTTTLEVDTLGSSQFLYASPVTLTVGQYTVQAMSGLLFKFGIFEIAP